MRDTDTRPSPYASQAREQTWFGHPRGLTILFLTEMWSDFSFFGMRTLLVYYMTQQLLISQRHSSLIYGAYASFAYLTPLLGGIVSDRWLGRRSTVLLGGGIMTAGHFLMAFEAMFYPALALIGLGNGLLLPSLSSQINRLYDDSDPRKASAYNIYYVGINMGGLLAPFACGTVGELFGWKWGFTLAGIGMVAGLIVYILGTPFLPPEQDAPKLAGAEQRHDGEAEKLGRSTALILAAIVILVVVYRSAYEQVGNTVALWADRGINRAVGDWTIPMTWFQGLNSLGIILFTPIIVAHWTRRARKGKNRSAVANMAIGAVILALSYLMLSVVSLHASETSTRASWLWLALFFLTFTAGELYILPVGLGLFGRIGPEKSMIAAWFAAACLGNLGAGVLGTLWSAMPPWQFFAIVAAVAAVAGGLLLALVPWARGADPDLRARTKAASAN